jgi:MOSC domain-containing protein YiiM
MTSRILSINCGKAAPFRSDDAGAIPRTIQSAIHKAPVIGRVRVLRLGLAGDEQADLTVHGGPDKAIHHYPFDHYAWWREALGPHPLLDAPGAFGENIVTEGLTETEICVGDRWRMGTALVEVSHGRQPCWKLDHRFGGAAVLARMVKSRRAGWYYRVIEEGTVAADDLLELVDRPFADWTVDRVFGLLIAGDHKRDRPGLEALGSVGALAEPWLRRRAALLAG